MAEISNGDKKGLWELTKDDVKIIKLQKGCIRTNCIDSLDRTSVVQSVIARNILHQQLHQLSLEIPLDDKASAFEPFKGDLEIIFRNNWTDNGNKLSLLYAGTNALKTDFTRTGKRTITGALMDGKNSLQRYYLNHFRDGYYQDCIDLTSAKISPSQGPLNERSLVNSGFVILLLFFLCFFIIKIVTQSFIPSISGSGKGQILQLLLYGISFFFIFRSVMANGYKFADCSSRNI